MGAYLKIARYAKVIKKELVIKILILLAFTGAYIAQGIALAQGTIILLSDRTRYREVIPYFVFVCFCFIIRAILLRVRDGYSKRIAGKLKASMRNMIIDKLMQLGPGYTASVRSGRLQSLVTDGVEYMEPFMVEYIPQVVTVVCSVIPLLIYIYTVNWQVGIVATIAVFFAIFMPHIMMPIVRKSTVEYWKGYAVLNAQYVDTMQGMTTLKIFHSSEAKEAELAKDSEAFRKQQITNTSHSLFSSSTINFMMALGASFTIGIAAFQTVNGSLAKESLILLLFLTIECMRPIGELNSAWHSSYLGFSVSDELLTILNEEIVINEPSHPITSGIDKGLPSISFNQVDFCYPGRHKNAIQSLNLKIEPGQSVAIVGMSGSGKSTLINLLLRFYDVNRGSICINDTDIRDFSLEYLRGKMSVVFQESYLFYGTVLENIQMARPNASKEEVIEAAKMTNAHDFIMELPNQYETLVGERGATLSGGQRQRLAIARAILKNTPILILDEATSNVDAASENIIQETMENLEQKYTTIIIAHRLSTIRNVQKILVFDKGYLVEQGTHEELVHHNGIYQKLIEAQKRTGEIDAD